RALLVAGIAALLLAAAAVAGTAYVRSQYYVGVDGKEVAVLRGVRGSIGSLDLHSVTKRPGIAVDDLTPFQQGRVRQGIDADSPAAADSIVERLRATARAQTAPGTGAGTAPSTTPTPTPSPTAEPAAPSPGAGA
ncbi:MAG: hypothetical protein M3P95_11400, partial [Actinomycetota bacterium]|nr:hypothetical protein [Actinomycetota bacterium]